MAYKPKNSKDNSATIDAFKLCTAVTSSRDTLIRVSDMPKEGQTVKSSIRDVRLEEEISAGGEAIVYRTNTPFIAKIYKREKNTTRRQKKIQLMLTKKVSCKGICYPVDSLTNENGEFVGYLMRAARGVELQRSVFAPKPVFLKKFPGWNKKDTVQLCVTILKKFQFLHERNIIVGDINPANILINSPTDVYIVDTDSFQIENK